MYYVLIDHHADSPEFYRNEEDGSVIKFDTIDYAEAEKQESAWPDDVMIVEIPD